MCLAVLLAGCDVEANDLTSRPVVDLSAPEQTVDAATSEVTRFVADAEGGARALLALSVGPAVPAASVDDEGVRGCVALLRSQGQAASVAVPVTVVASVAAGPAGLRVDLSDVRVLPDRSSSYRALWAVTYSDIPGQCKRNGGAVVQWSSSAGVEHTWSTWLVMLGDESDVDPLLLRPEVQVDRTRTRLRADAPPGPNLLACATEDGVTEEYFALDAPAALDHGCSSPAGITSRGDQLCRTQYPDASSRTTDGTTVYDRAASMLQVCQGFGAPAGLTLTAPMKCALIAAGVTFAGPPGAGSRVESSLCRATSVATAYRSGEWLGLAQGEACSYFSDVFAGGVGVVAAGATSASGPGAVAVGLGTYKAVASGLKLACGGLLDGGALALGEYLESAHQRHVAVDVTRHGKCLAYDNRAGRGWSAVDCTR